MANGSNAPLTPTEVLAKIRYLAAKYQYVPLGKGRREGSVAKRIAEETGLGRRYVRYILNGQRRKVGDSALELTINSLTLVRGTGRLCRLCGNPCWLFCFPQRVCVQCGVIDLGKRGLVTIHEVEPAVPNIDDKGD